jgi:hypothetical protein
MCLLILGLSQAFLDLSDALKHPFFTNLNPSEAYIQAVTNYTENLDLAGVKYLPLQEL